MQTNLLNVRAKILHGGEATHSDTAGTEGVIACVWLDLNNELKVLIASDGGGLTAVRASRIKLLPPSDSGD